MVGDFILAVTVGSWGVEDAQALNNMEAIPSI